VENDVDGEDGQIGEDQDGPAPPELWALSPSLRALHWGSVVLLLMMISFGSTQLLRSGPATGGWVFVVIPLLLMAQQLRAVVAVWLDPSESTLIMFRAAGGAVRTRTDRVRRLDHGALDAIWRSSRRDYRAIRVTTDDGTAALSVFFTNRYELADALARTSPQAHLDV